jgi:hypothetical protein
MKSGTGIITLVGESLELVEYLEKKLEESEKARVKRNDKREKPRTLLFPSAIVSMWKNASSETQRAIEMAAGVTEFHRHDLRRTIATYLGYVDAPESLVSSVLSHTKSKSRAQRGKDEGAQATKIYKRNDTNSQTMSEAAALSKADTNQRTEVARALLLAQALLRDIEAGKLTPRLVEIQDMMGGGDQAGEMIDRYEVNPAFINIESPVKAKATAKASVAALPAALAEMAKKKAESRKRGAAKAKAKREAKKKATALRVEKSGSTVAAV